MMEVDEQRLYQAILGNTRELLRLPNVVGVAPGAKGPDAVGRVHPAVVVLVRKKVPLTELAPGEVVPRQIEGFDTEVVEVGEIHVVKDRED